MLRMIDDTHLVTQGVVQVVIAQAIDRELLGERSIVPGVVLVECTREKPLDLSNGNREGSVACRSAQGMQ